MTDESKPLLSSDDLVGLNKSLKLTKSASNRFSIKLSEVSEQREIDFVTAVFVAKFDAKAGNIIEWSYPINLESSEFLAFKALPSGAHKVDSDFIYFKYNNLYGLGCYARLRVENEVERGARMKTVAILAPNYSTLFKHMQFLEHQVLSQLRNPLDYDALQEFLHDHQTSVYVNPINIKSTEPSAFNYQSLNMSPMTITHPAGCFSQFINFFGPSVFVLWKLVMLRKRILFFSPPPIGVVCYRVYCACCLGKITVDSLNSNVNNSILKIEKIKPFFYINVADIESISQQETYIACTTEKVFEEKNVLYDVYVNNQRVTSANQHLNSCLMKINKSDIEKYNNLIKFKSDLKFQRLNDSNGNLPSEESFYQAYYNKKTQVKN